MIREQRTRNKRSGLSLFPSFFLLFFLLSLLPASFFISSILLDYFSSISLSFFFTFTFYFLTSSLPCLTSLPSLILFLYSSYLFRLDFFSFFFSLRLEDEIEINYVTLTVSKLRNLDLHSQYKSNNFSKSLPQSMRSMKEQMREPETLLDLYCECRSRFRNLEIVKVT